MKTLCRTKGLAHDLIVTRDGATTTLWSATGIRHSVIDSAAPHQPGLEYARHMLAALAFCPQAQSCLVLGLGGGSIPRMLLAARPQLRVEAVEIDGAVVELATRYFNVLSLPRLTIHLQDAAGFLQQCKSRFELVIVDTYLGEHFPEQCMTPDFLRDARRCMQDDGVLAVNWLKGDSPSRYDLLRKIESAVSPVWQLPGLSTRNRLFFAPAGAATRPAIMAAAASDAIDATFHKTLRQLVLRLRNPGQIRYKCSERG